MLADTARRLTQTTMTLSGFGKPNGHGAPEVGILGKQSQYKKRSDRIGGLCIEEKNSSIYKNRNRSG